MRSIGAACAAGSRREPTSLVVMGGARNDRGKLFIHLWKQMLPQLGDMIDTHCGFTGFRAEAVSGLTADTTEKRFSFDIELLLRCALQDEGSIERMPVAWIDSEAAFTTADLDPHLEMLPSVVTMYRTYLTPSDRPESFVRLAEHMDGAAWHRLVASIPPPIVEREPLEFSNWAGWPPANSPR